MNTPRTGARRRVWVTGFIFLSLISGLAVLSARAGIEAQIRAQAADRLAEAGYAWLHVEVSGRNVVLRGAVFSEQDRAQAEGALRDIWGVGAVESRLQVAVRERPYTISITRSDNSMKLRGSVPDETARKTILGLVKANFPGIKLSAKLQIDPNMAETERWLTGVGFALSQLKHVASGRTVLADTELSFEGRAAKPGGYEALMRGFREETPDNISVTQMRVQAPHVEPFVWRVGTEDGNVILRGHVPSERAKAQMTMLAHQLFPNAQVRDQTQVADGEPVGWWAAARLALQALDHLQTGSVTLAPSEIKLEGVAKSVAAQSAISALKDAWPSGFNFTASVRLSRSEPGERSPHRASATGIPPARL